MVASTVSRLRIWVLLSYSFFFGDSDLVFWEEVEGRGSPFREVSRFCSIKDCVIN